MKAVGLFLILLSQASFAAPGIKSLTLDGQAIALFDEVHGLLSAFEKVKVGSTDQNLQDRPVSTQEVQRNPLMIYRNRNPLLVRQADYSDPQQMAHSVLSSVARADLPEELVANPVWKKFLVLIPRIAQGKLAQLNKSELRTASLVLGGFLWRFRGAGGFDSGLDTGGRRSIFVAQGFAALAKMNGASDSVAFALGNALKLSVSMTSWGPYHSIGRPSPRQSGLTKYEDFQKMQELGRGLVQNSITVLSWSGYEGTKLLALAGRMLGSCYYYSWEALPNQLQIGAKMTDPYLFIFGAPTNFGEFCAGASMGLALSHILKPD